MTNYERIKNMSVDELTDTMKSELGTLADFTDLIKSSTIKEFAENIDNQLLALKKHIDTSKRNVSSMLVGLQ